jgi:hypothetical protein
LYELYEVKCIRIKELTKKLAGLKEVCEDLVRRCLSSRDTLWFASAMPSCPYACLEYIKCPLDCGQEQENSTLRDKCEEYCQIYEQANFQLGQQTEAVSELSEQIEDLRAQVKRAHQGMTACQSSGRCGGADRASTKRSPSVASSFVCSIQHKTMLPSAVRVKR